MPRWLAAAGLVAGAVLVTACSSPRSPWWQETGATSCGPPALVRVAGHARSAGACSGNFLIPAPRVTVHVGQKIDVHMTEEHAGNSGNRLVPVWPLPHSSPASVLTRAAVSADKATATYTARHPGHAALVTNADCMTTRTGRQSRGACPVLNGTVLP